MTKLLQRLNRGLAILLFTRPALFKGAVFLLGITVGPLALIWTWNTLFSIGTPYSFQSWFATLFFVWTVNYILSLAFYSAVKTTQSRQEKADSRRNR